MDLPPLDPARDALRDHVLAHSLKRGDFTLKSGAKSSWFLDTKQTACRPDGMLLMADVALSLIPDDADAIGGLTIGADPVAYAVAAIAATRGRALRSFTVRKEAKDHGVTGRIAGALQPGDRVVITEDTVTRGTSIMEAVEVVRAFGAHPVLMLPNACHLQTHDTGTRWTLTRASPQWPQTSPSPRAAPRHL